MDVPRVFLFYYRWSDGTGALASLKTCMEHYVALRWYTPQKSSNRLREGIELEDGPAAPAEVEIVSNDAKLKALSPHRV